jgi:hypothetical protein
MKAKIKVIMDKAIDEGVDYGLHRSYKHTDKPDRSHMHGEIVNAIWLALEEVIEFEEEEPYVLQ